MPMISEPYKKGFEVEFRLSSGPKASTITQKLASISDSVAELGSVSEIFCGVLRLHPVRNKAITGLMQFEDALPESAAR
jgi:hypothetical protein